MDPSNNPSPAPTSTPPAGDPAGTPPADPSATPPANEPAATPPANEPVQHPGSLDPQIPAATPPADPPADPNAPPAGDPANPPEGNDPEGDIATPEEGSAAAIAAANEDDPVNEQIKESMEKNGGELPSGVNPDGTIDPLVFAYENIPMITVRGKEGSKGEIKEYQVKTAEELPDNFVYANGKEQALFNQAATANVNSARQYISDAQNYNAERSIKLQTQQHAVAQKNEIEALQKDGKLPAFTKKPTDKDFMSDPAAIRTQEVLDFIKETNQGYKDANVNQEITSITVGLQLLEAKEAAEGKQTKVTGIQQQRNNINSQVSGGGTPPAGGNGNSQRIHSSTEAAVEAGLKRAQGL